MMNEMKMAQFREHGTGTGFGFGVTVVSGNRNIVKMNVLNV